MLTVLYILIGLLALLFSIHLIAPKEYNVFRTVEISKPKSEVFNYLKSLKSMDDWSPWAKKDPNMQKKFSGTDGEVGCISYWNGNKHVGEGEQDVFRVGDRIRIQVLCKRMSWGFDGERLVRVVRVFCIVSQYGMIWYGMVLIL